MVTGGGFRALSAGDALMLGAAAVCAAHETLMGSLTANKPYSSITVTLIQSVICALVAIAFRSTETLGSAAHFSTVTWLNLAYLGLACSVFAFLIQLWAVQRTSASRASLLMGTEPVWAVAMGVGLAGETLDWLGALGAILIVVGCYAGQKIESRFRAKRSARAGTAGPRSPVHVDSS